MLRKRTSSAKLSSIHPSYNTVKTLKLTTILACLTATVSHAAITSLEIGGVINELNGSNSTITGGDVSNLWVGTLIGGTTSAAFQMFNSDTNVHTADMRVTYLSNTLTGGASVNNTDSSGLMIARTVNSQGLTDGGTLSILSRYNTLTAGQSAAMNFKFEFFQPGTTTPLPIEVRVTNLDLDFDQRIRVSNSEFITPPFALGGNLASSNSGGFTTYFDNVVPFSVSTVANPLNAAVIDTNLGDEFDIRLGTTLPGADFALFMFEFRAESEIIPEPSAALLGGLGMLALLRRRRSA